MSSAFKCWAAVLFSLVCAVVVWAQGLVVCGSCGREAKPGETVCSHCKASLPQPREEVRPAAEARAASDNDGNAEAGRLAVAAVGDNLRQARGVEKERPDVALSYYQNALALSRLVPAGLLPAGAGEAILSGCERTKQSLLRGQVPCRACNGSGNYQLDMGKVDKNKGVKAVDGMPCPVCKGAGSVPGMREVSKVMMAIQQGRQEFERRQMVAGEVRVGRALVPAELEPLLTCRQRALVMTAVPVPCGACQLTGRQACTACKGTGWTRCDNEDCVHGILKAQSRNHASGQSSSSRSRTEKRIGEDPVKKCPRCGGLGEIPCVVCKGSGSGVCKVCDGSGQAKRCLKCKETAGLMPCSKCKGSGDVNGKPCTVCKGEKVCLCSACRGEGAIAR